MFTFATVPARWCRLLSRLYDHRRPSPDRHQIRHRSSHLPRSQKDPRSGIPRIQDPVSYRILEPIFSFFRGILMILDPVTAILPWDPRDLLHCYGSYIVISSWDPGDPGSFFFVFAMGSWRSWILNFCLVLGSWLSDFAMGSCTLPHFATWLRDTVHDWIWYGYGTNCYQILPCATSMPTPIHVGLVPGTFILLWDPTDLRSL